METKMIRRSVLVSALVSLPAALAVAEARVAIQGFDPVAYFTMGKPVTGRSEHSVELDGVRWQFANEEHRRLFQADPDRYVPQYAGHCAYGVALGKKVEIDPQAWTIVDGKLYLNYSLEFRKEWQADQQRLIADADRNWQQMAGK